MIRRWLTAWLMAGRQWVSVSSGSYDIWSSSISYEILVSLDMKMRVVRTEINEATVPDGEYETEFITAEALHESEESLGLSKYLIPSRPAVEQMNETCIVTEDHLHNIKDIWDRYGDAREDESVASRGFQ